MKYISDGDFDDKIRRTFDYMTKDIDASDNMLSQIKSELNGGTYMKRNLKKVTIAIAAVVLSLTAVTGIIAASGVHSWISSSSHLTEKSDFPDKDTIKSEFGYNFKYVKEFDNGFKFSKYNFVESKGLDENDNVVNEEKEATFDYVKDAGTDNENTIYFNAVRRPEYMYESTANFKSVNYKNIDINYSKDVYKTFPPDFENKEVTSEDKQKAQKLIAEVREINPNAEDITKVYPYLTNEDIEAYKNNQLILAYGSKEIETKHIQSASWYDNGVSYNIMRLDGSDIDDNEFIAMAKKVIDAE